jgi:hypothetical protein
MSSVNSLAQHGHALEVGSVVVDASGGLARRLRDRVAFHFTIDGMRFDGAVESRGDGRALTLTADLGVVPYTAEDRQARVDVNAVLAASRTDMAHGRLAISPDQHVRMAARIDVGAPMTPVKLLAAATEVVHAAMPWLKLVREMTDRASRTGRR